MRDWLASWILFFVDKSRRRRCSKSGHTTVGQFRAGYKVANTKPSFARVYRVVDVARYCTRCRRTLTEYRNLVKEKLRQDDRIVSSLKRDPQMARLRDGGAFFTRYWLSSDDQPINPSLDPNFKGLQGFIKAHEGTNGNRANQK